MTRKDLNLIGQRYATSKCHTIADLDHSLQHLGYRGEALASTINCSGTVEILSRHRLSQETYSKIFLHGTPMPVTPSSSQRPSIGTTIAVHDFFYNLPVRRRLITADLELENIRQTILSVALANPSISFSLKNDLIGECILQTRRTNSVLASFSILFGSSKASSMKEISFEHEIFNITGYLSTESHHSKSLQFIYVNGRVVKRTSLHSCVNNLIANSLIARCLSRQADSRWRGVETDIASPKRVSEKHAVYVLMIRCPRAEYDVCLEPAKTLIEFRDWDVILDCLTQVVRHFLVKHSLTLGPGCVDGEEGGEEEGEEREEEGEGEEEGTDVAECSSSEEHCGSEAGGLDQVFTSGGDSTACLNPVGGEVSLDIVSTSGQLERNGAVTVMQSDPFLALRPEKPSSIWSHTKRTPGTAMEHQRSCKGDAEKHGLKKVGHAASLLHLDRPARSPLNSHSTASKLAGFLRSEKPKLYSSHNTVLTSRQDVLPVSIGCGQDGCLMRTLPAGLSTVPASIGHDRQDSMPCSIGHDRQSSMPATIGHDTIGHDWRNTLSAVLQKSVPASLSCSGPLNTVPASMCCEQRIPNFHVLQNTMLASEQQGLDRCDLWNNMPTLSSEQQRQDLSSEQWRQDLCDLPTSEQHGQDLCDLPTSKQPCDLWNTMPTLSSEWQRQDLCDLCNALSSERQKLDLHGPQNTAPVEEWHRPDPLGPQQTVPASLVRCGQESCTLGQCSSAGIVASGSSRINMQPDICSEHFPPTHPPATLPILQKHNSSLRDHALCLDPASVSIDPTVVEDLAPSTHAINGTDGSQAPADTCAASACFECQLTEHTNLVPLNSESNLEDDGGSEVHTVDKEHRETGTVTDLQGIWKEVFNPITAKKVYVHSKTGNSYPSIPSSHSRPEDTGTSIATAGPSEPGHSGNEGAGMCHGVGGVLSPCYGAKPIRAAPHLSHDFHCFLPGAKRLKLDDSVDTSKSQSVPGNSIDGSRDDRDGVWRDSEDSGPFESLLRNWKNPTFLPGQEVRAKLISSTPTCARVDLVTNDE